MNFFPRLPLQYSFESSSNGSNAPYFERRFSLKLINPDVPTDVGIDELDSENYYPSISSKLIMRSYVKGAYPSQSAAPSTYKNALKDASFPPPTRPATVGQADEQSPAILRPSSPDIISQLNNFSFNKGGSTSTLSVPEEVKGPFTPEPKYYSEFDMETNAGIYKHQYLVVRSDFLIGKRHLRAGEHGYLTLSSLATIKTRVSPVFRSSESFPPSYDDFARFSIREEWESPSLRQRQFFNDNATLVFVERPGQYTKGGDPLFEFIGNFYVRRLDAVLVDGMMLARQLHVAHAVSQVLSKKNALLASGPLADSLVLLQSVRESDLI